MRRPLQLLVSVIVALGLLAPVATASDGSGHHSPWWSDHPAPISAQEFLTAAAASNQFEIVTGQLAQERASAPEIKALGAEFVEHHTMLLQQGRAVAAKLGIVVPETLTPKQQRIVARLQQLSGKRFDRKWLAAQIAAHREALALNLRGAIRGDVPEIRTLAQGALPIVAQHYGQLLDIAGDYKWSHHYGDGYRHHGDHDRSTDDRHHD
jgi:putative membrane protein